MKKSLKGVKPSGDMVHKMAIKSVKMTGKKKITKPDMMAMKKKSSTSMKGNKEMKASKKGVTGMKGNVKRKGSAASMQAGRSMAGGRLVFNSDNKNTSPLVANSTPQAKLKRSKKKLASK